jgi:predicted nuclease of predicted toxin-antitoxin system
MKILIDMNLSPLWAPFPAAAGIERIHWPQVRPGHAPDHEIINYDVRNDMAILTRDPDLGALLSD